MDTTTSKATPVINHLYILAELGRQHSAELIAAANKATLVKRAHTSRRRWCLAVALS